MKCDGSLRHIFHGGDTVAIIGLRFADEKIAKAAIEKLPGFEQGQNAAVLIRSFTSDQLEDFKSKMSDWGLQIKPCGYRHCKKQCSDAEIDNVAHSIDRGAAWTMDVPVEHPDQMKLVMA